MKKVKITPRNQLQSVETYEGETIEQKIKRILDENEPIKDGAPIIYTDKKDGVLPAYNIRTDRWAIAIDAMDKVSSYEASKYLRDGNIQELEKNKNEAELKINTEGEPKAPESN